MGEFTSNFHDIEMLEIPDDDVISMSSDTEGISESPKTPTEPGSQVSIFQSNKQYIELSQWLKGEDLQFQFDADQYKQSLKLVNDFESAYIEYTNSLYKSVDKLIKDVDISSELEEDDSDDEQIGVITNDRIPVRGLPSPSIFQKIDETYQEIVENLKMLIEVTKDVPESKYQHLLFILQCLGANYFYFDIKRKPELILEWVNTFHTKPEPELIETIMIQFPQPYLHPQFWNIYISQLITRGLFTQTNLAIEHSKFEELEETCPELYSIIADLNTLLADYSSFALKGQFPQWKLLACEFRDSIASVKGSVVDPQHSIILSQIFDLACIITGLPKTISMYCDTWYEVYLALSLYKVRDDNDELYPEYFQTAIHEKVVSATGDSLEDITEGCFVDILEGNFLKTLKTMHDLEPTTTAYVSELLELKGLLQGYYNVTSSANIHDLKNKKTISEYFMLRHGYESLNIHDLVPVGLGILQNKTICSSSQLNNRTVIGEFLPEYECQANDDLEWALTICAQLNLITTARQLYYNYGVKSLEDGYIYEALNNFVNCYGETGGEIHQAGVKQVHYIIWDVIFLDSITNNRPSQDELINNLVTKSETSIDIHPVIRQCLAPYAVLKAFFDSLDDESVKFNVKFSKLLHLLRFNYMPKKFIPLLLSQLLPFLTSASSEFLLPDLVVMIEVIDSFENETSEEEIQDAGALYVYTINHIESETSSYDWRVLLDKDVPRDVDSLVRTLRNKIAIRIAQVYID
ncbi:Nucleoporin NUP85 [Spathaspora sp. JA1]|nr:Nucleoporin NUP85 [Spathaspora sp. JA1]